MFSSYPKRIITIVIMVVLISVAVIYWVNIGRQISLENCLSDDPKVANSCLLKATANTFKKGGYEFAYSWLEGVKKEYPSPLFTSSCEDSYYFMGQKGYEAYLEGQALSSPTKPSVCTDAFYGGILNVWEKNGSDEEAILSICNLVNSKLPTRTWDQCFFNVGQGLVFRGQEQVDNKMAKELVDSSIDFCERIPGEHTFSKSSCIAGVFNALNMAYLLGDRGIYMDPNRPFALCEEQTAINRRQCYRNLTSSLYYLSGKNLFLASEYISSIENFGERYETTLTLFSNLAFEPVDADEVVRNCINLHGNIRNACIQGYAIGLLEAKEADTGLEAVMYFCLNSLFTTKEKGLCIYRAFYDLGPAYPGKAGNMCKEMVDEELEQYCPV